MNIKENQALSEQERKWRSPSKAAFPLESQGDAFSSGSPEKQEPDRNNPAYCKTDCRGAIDAAARFLAVTEPGARPRPLVPALRSMFGLTAVETCQAIRQSHEIRARTA